MEDELKEIILDNRNLIYSVIHRFKGSDYDDLYQVGCLGLINAYHNFNPSMNVKFSTYAYPFIVGEIYRYIANNRNIHMSPDNVRLLNSIHRAEDFLINHLGRSPSDKEICDFLEIDLFKLHEIRSMMMVDSLDYQYDNCDMYDFASIESFSKDDMIDLKNAINSLDEREKQFIYARYFYNVTQSDLAKKYNTNQVKISRDERKILTKLKVKMY